jgi:hypothetical protein
LADVSQAALQWLGQVLERRLAPEAKTWMEEKRAGLGDDRQAFLAFALAPRKVGKDDLELSQEETEQAQECCPGWSLDGWTLDQAARVVLLLAGPDEAFERRLDQLCATGDVGELVTLYQGLPIYPRPEIRAARAAEGVRTNIVPVFEAVAHRNPFCRTYFDEPAWNQMVLKALFIGSSLDPIQGLEERANATLARTLIDYAHERWAAGRSFSPELWRCVGPFLEEAWLSDFRRGLDSTEPMEPEAVALALRGSALPGAQELLSSVPDLVKAIDSGALSWRLVHQRVVQGA